MDRTSSTCWWVSKNRIVVKSVLIAEVTTFSHTESGTENNLLLFLYYMLLQGSAYRLEKEKTFNVLKNSDLYIHMTSSYIEKIGNEIDKYSQQFKAARSTHKKTVAIF